MDCLPLAVTTHFFLTRGSKRLLVGTDRSTIWQWSEYLLTARCIDEIVPSQVVIHLNKLKDFSLLVLTLQCNVVHKFWFKIAKVRQKFSILPWRINLTKNNKSVRKTWCTLSIIYSINQRGCPPPATTSLCQVYLSFIALGIYNFGAKESDER